MIVCICNNVSDRAIRRAVASGMTTMGELRRNLGVATCCGKCDSCARQVLKTCLAEAKTPVEATSGFDSRWVSA